MRQNPLLRQAFTLVELLVATGIIAMLLALVAISYPSFNEREQLTRAVDKLRSGLLTARLWARRDNAITGVQYIPDQSGSLYGFIYVQQPFAEFSGVASVSNSNSLTITIDRVGKDLISNSLLYCSKIKPTDYLVLDGDVPHRIATGGSASLSLLSPIAINCLPNHPFKIIRGVERIPLQEDSVLGDRIAVEPLSGNSPLRVPPNPFTICFSPTGQVINAPATCITLRLTQGFLTVGSLNETADVLVDCLSGTTRYRNP
ncbi:MAG: prepilin-type N-terminal cleavage/methylation domain-containing protein [Planctomycetota bacterium]|nr:MAG: prepilin-type N-terminal cleavage/methylation domain-containing protein [Planctomycetota bacterium]